MYGWWGVVRGGGVTLSETTALRCRLARHGHVCMQDDIEVEDRDAARIDVSVNRRTCLMMRSSRIAARPLVLC